MQQSCRAMEQLQWAVAVAGQVLVSDTRKETPQLPLALRRALLRPALPAGGEARVAVEGLSKELDMSRQAVGEKDEREGGKLWCGQ